MANLFDGIVDTEGQYEDLETELSITLVAETTYSVQVKSGNCVISKDSSGGLIIPAGVIWNFTPQDGDTYYICTSTPSSICIL